MAYNVEKLAKLGALKELGLKQKAVDEAQNKRIKALEDVGAQANVLEGVKVNGVALAIAEKMVDILVATGSKNGSISVAGTDVAIKGLAALAYKAKISQSGCCSGCKGRQGHYSGWIRHHRRLHQGRDQRQDQRCL